MRPESGFSKPAIIRSVVVLPQPEAPEQRIELAGRDVEVDTGDGGHPVERLGQLLQPDRAARHRRTARSAAATAVGEPGEVGGEPVDIVLVVLNGQQPLLHLAPWREKHPAIVLHEPVQVAQSGVDLAGSRGTRGPGRGGTSRSPWRPTVTTCQSKPCSAIDGFQRGRAAGAASASRCA